MGESSKLLETLGASRISKGVTDFFAMLLSFFNMLFRPVEIFVRMVAESQGITRLTWGIDLCIALASLVYVYMTEVTNVPKGAFAVTELTARSVLFLSGLSLTLLSLSSVLSYFLSTNNLQGPVLDIVAAGFSEKYDAYQATFRHGVHAMMAVSITMLWGLDDDRHIRWVGSDEADQSSTVIFLQILFYALLVSKFLSEVKHGEDARLLYEEKEIIGSSAALSADYRFKHARGAALTVSTGLLIYMVVNADTSDGFWSFLGSKLIALSLSIYILVVAMERIAGQSEWVIGGAGGLVITGIVSTLNLVAAGMALAEDKSQEAVVVALGVIFLDAMRVGYGQPVPERAVVSDVRKVLLRLLQALAGIVSFVYITKSETGEHAASSPLLFGVALASSLLKIVGISYIGKDLFKSSTEHHFRELASTGLLLSAAYLWSHPLDESASSTIADLFFALGVSCRFLDSILDFLMSGKDAVKYITWDKEDEDEGVRSPTSDNPRTWLTLLSLVVSLVFASMAMHEKIDDIKLVDGKAAQKELSDSMIVAITFISVHVAVVLLGLLSDVVKPLALGALSRSKFIRFAVTTTVLSSLAVAAGAIGFEGEGVLSSDSVQTEILSALVAYLFADVVGRELL